MDKLASRKHRFLMIKISSLRPPAERKPLVNLVFPIKVALILPALRFVKKF